MSVFQKVLNEIILMTYALKHHQKSFQLDLQKLPPTYSSIHIHIKRACFQCYLWVPCTVESIEINPGDYGYELTGDDMLVPTITTKDVISHDFPVLSSTMCQVTCVPVM